jgi:thiamine pyrophosphokinase
MLATNGKPVIIICMRIEKDFTNDDNDDIFELSDISATKAMDAVTDVLGDWFIVPALASGELDKVQQETLAHIKFALNIIAKKAQAWEDYQHGLNKNKNSRN